MLAPLAGFVVGITGDRRAEEQAQLLVRRGAQVVHGAVMRTVPLADADLALTATEQVMRAGVDHVVLMTGIGVRSWFGVAETVGLDDALRRACAPAHVVARGPKARGAANAQGVDVNWMAEHHTSAEIIEHLREIGVAGQRVVVQRDGGEPMLAAAIASLGAEVIDVPVYRWTGPVDAGPATRLLSAAVGRRLHALTFTCAHAVRMAFELAPDRDRLVAVLNTDVAAVAVGPVCAGALRAHGIEQVVEPRRALIGAMVQALVHHLRHEHRMLRIDEHLVRWQGELLEQADGSTAILTAGERRVLVELVRRAPAVVPKRALAESGADDHAAEAAVGRLRTKLGPLADGIRTVPRRGYSCTLEVSEVPGE